MGPAEIVASLKELCAEKGPRLTTEDVVAWIDRLGGFGSSPELIEYAKKMKARQYARLLEFEDEESGLRIKRLWSFHDPKRSRRYYMDILEMPDEQRTRLIRQYARFLKQLRSVRKAMADYFAGQRFFEFYPGDVEDESERPPPLESARQAALERTCPARLADATRPSSGRARTPRLRAASAAHRVPGSGEKVVGAAAEAEAGAEVELHAAETPAAKT